MTPAAEGKPATWVGFKNSNLDRLHKDYITKWGVGDPYSPCDGSESQAAKGDSGGKQTGTDHFKWLTVMQEKLMGLSKAQWDDDAKAVEAICKAYLVAWNKKKNGGEVHASVAAGYNYVGGSLKNERASEGLAGGATSASTNKKNWCAQASTAMFMIGLLHNGMTIKGVPLPSPGGKNEGAALLRYLRLIGNSFEDWKKKYLTEKNLTGTGHEKDSAGYQPGDIVSVVKNGGPPNGHVATVAASTGKTAGSKLDIISGNAAGVQGATDGAVRAEQLTIADSPPGYNYETDRKAGKTPQIAQGEVVVVSVTKSSAVDANKIAEQRMQNPQAMQADMEKWGLQPIDLQGLFGTTDEGKAKIGEIIGG